MFKSIEDLSGHAEDISSIEDLELFQDVMKQMSENELVSHYDQMAEMIDEGMFDGGTEGAKSFAEQLSEAAYWGSQIASAFVGVDDNIARWGMN